MINPLNAQQFLMKFATFGLSASVDIKQLPGAWVAGLLGVILRGAGPIKDESSHVHYTGHGALKC